MSNVTQWEKLNFKEFQQLQDLASYSNKKLQDVLQEYYRINHDEDIDYDGFKKFLDILYECDMPEDLCKHLFVSFLRPPFISGELQLQGNTLELLSTAPVGLFTAPITSHSIRGSIPNISTITTPRDMTTPEASKHSFVDKIQGLTDKLHSLSHLGHDSLDNKKSGSIHPVPNQLTINALGESSPSHSHSQSHSQISRNSSRKSNNSLNCKLDADIQMLQNRFSFIKTERVSLKDVVCYLSLLEAGRPEDKLEFMFRLYDTNSDGVLDSMETDSIVNQMMSVAEYLGWDNTELRPILQEMMLEIDFDGDGLVTLEEWKRGGLTTIPLLVLLGVETIEEGFHVWRLKNFSRTTYCNLCHNILKGLGKKGLCCNLCKYTVHERCVQRAPSTCIQTYVKSRTQPIPEMQHWWVGLNCKGRCFKCRKKIKAYDGIKCRWCQNIFHNRCATNIKAECNLGKFANYILPPTAICPAVLDRQRSSSVTNMKAKTTSAPLNFQVSPTVKNTPLLVFVNPKSGGRQGDRILRKFQYLLNPRQVYDLSKSTPTEGLTMFKDIEHFKIIVCGGDGTVGWILGAMDAIPLRKQPEIAIIPLGTGNDLARALGWGGGWTDGEKLPKILEKLKNASAVMMDRWNIEVKVNNTEDTNVSQHKALKMTLSENVQKVVIQHFECTKSVIQHFDQTQKNSTKTTEISIENTKRLILDDNTSTITEKSLEKSLEVNGSLKDCEKFSDKEIILGNTSQLSQDNNQIESSDRKPNSPTVKKTISCGDFPSYAEQQKLKQEEPDADFAVPYDIINNYFSIGVDAAICNKFHLEREKNPHKFNSRMKNKLWYFEYATSETFAASCKNLHENVTIVCDGVELDLANGVPLQGIAIMNIPYTHGGTNLWGSGGESQKKIRRSTSGPFSKKKLKGSEKDLSANSFNSVDLSIAVQDIGDRKIEVIGLESCLQIAQVRTGLKLGRRLAQCSEIILTTKKKFPCQIDGEPWMQSPAIIKISHKNQIPMLMAPKSEKSGFFSFLKR